MKDLGRRILLSDLGIPALALSACSRYGGAARPFISPRLPSQPRLPWLSVHARGQPLQAVSGAPRAKRRPGASRPVGWPAAPRPFPTRPAHQSSRAVWQQSLPLPLSVSGWILRGFGIEDIAVPGKRRRPHGQRVRPHVLPPAFGSRTAELPSEAPELNSAVRPAARRPRRPTRPLPCRSPVLSGLSSRCALSLRAPCCCSEWAPSPSVHCPLWPERR